MRNTLRDVVAEANGELRNELAAQRILLEIMQKHRSATEEEEYIRRQRQLEEDADFAILKNLEFATMGERREEIHEAHKTTFSWIFRDPDTAGPSGNVGNTDYPWTNFAHGLRQGEEIYWINGKAGSGKSPLMRYIRENPDTLKHSPRMGRVRRIEGSQLLFLVRWFTGATFTSRFASISAS